MDSRYHISAIPGLTRIQTILFEEWIKLSEPPFFSVNENLLDKTALYSYPCLIGWSSIVTLLSVNDVLFKLDGADKKALWLNDETRRPPVLHALVFEITETEFGRMVSDTHHQAFLKLPAQEQIKAFYSELNLELTSDRLKHGFITEAIHIALRGRQRILQDKRSAREKEDIDMKKAVAIFSNELRLIDRLNMQSDIFVTGVLAASLIMLGKGVASTENFLVQLNAGNGRTSDDGRMCPVNALLKIIHRHKLGKKNVQPRTAIELCKKTAQAIQAWDEGEASSKYWRTRDFTGIELQPLILEMKLLKKINADKDL